MGKFEETVNENALQELIGTLYNAKQRADRKTATFSYGKSKAPTEQQGKYDARMLLSFGETEKFREYRNGYYPVIVNYGERYSSTGETPLDKTMDNWLTIQANGESTSGEKPKHCVLGFDSQIDYTKTFGEQNNFTDIMARSAGKGLRRNIWGQGGLRSFGENMRRVDPVGAVSLFRDWISGVTTSAAGGTNFGYKFEDLRDRGGYALVLNTGNQTNAVDIVNTIYFNDQATYNCNVLRIIKETGVVGCFLSVIADINNARSSASSTTTPPPAGGGSPAGSVPMGGVPAGGAATTPPGGAPSLNPTESLAHTGRGVVINENGIPSIVGGDIDPNVNTGPEDLIPGPGTPEAPKTTKTLREIMSEMIANDIYGDGGTGHLSPAESSLNRIKNTYLSRLVDLNVNESDLDRIKTRLGKVNTANEISQEIENDLYDYCGVPVFPKESMKHEEFLKDYFNVVSGIISTEIPGFSDDLIFVTEKTARDLNKTTGVVKSKMLMAAITERIGNYIRTALKSKFNAVVNQAKSKLFTTRVDRTRNILS